MTDDNNTNEDLGTPKEWWADQQAMGPALARLDDEVRRVDYLEYFYS